MGAGSGREFEFPIVPAANHALTLDVPIRQPTAIVGADIIDDKQSAASVPGVGDIDRRRKTCDEREQRDVGESGDGKGEKRGVNQQR